MAQLGLFWGFLFFGQMFYSTSALNKTYEIHKNKDSNFHGLCLATGSSYISHLDRNALQTLFLGLKFRTGCDTEHCDQCLSVKRIDGRRFVKNSLTKNELVTVLRLLRSALRQGQDCFNTVHPKSNIEGRKLIYLLEEINEFYEPTLYQSKTLYIPPWLENSNSENTIEVISKFILAIYKGQRIVFGDEDDTTSKRRTIRESGEVVNANQETETITPTNGGDTTYAIGEDGYTTAMKYGYGTAAVAVISAFAFSGIVFFPSMKTKWFQQVMQFFIALGVGTMSGDAILHIIPEVIGSHDHGSDDEGESFSWKLLAVLGGIWLLFLFENALKFAERNQKTKNDSAEKRTIENPSNEIETVTKFVCSNSHEVVEMESEVDGSTIAANHANTDDVVDHVTTLCFGITSMAMMIFIGDLLHNFGDGIAIGASFSVSWSQGVGTSLAIFCHELPHEFGDFAIYLNNGMSRCKALLLNFLAACCAFFGLYVGLALSENEEIRQWLLAVVAGMFLYISLVNVLHEMISKESDRHLLQFVVQNTGLLLGWSILFVIAYYEESITESFT